MATAAIGVSDVGRVRKVNEDAFACLNDLGFYVVADGMGGHQAGEVASSLAVETMVGFITRTADSSECSWPYGIDTSLSFDGNRMRTAIHLANRRVFRAAEDQDDYTGMGTTVVSALLSNTSVVVGHVGDSRLYSWDSRDLTQVTRDDTWAMTILAPEIGDDAARASTHAMKNVLTNVVGARAEALIHVAEVPRDGVDLLLLCTDGVHGVLSNDTIGAELARSAAEALEVRANALLQAAMSAGARDNVTVVLVALDGGVRP